MQKTKSKIPKPIFTVTTIRLPKDADSYHSSRCVGWFPVFKHAEDEILNNSCDIYEYYYNYAVIEEVMPGLYANRRETWYSWNLEKEQYEKCEKPEKLKHIVHYSMG